MKHLMTVVVAVLALALFSVPVRAARVQTGADLLEFCQMVIESKPSNAAMVDGVACIAYLKGMSETFDFWKVFNDKRRQNNPPPACVPNGLTGREMAIVVVKFIKLHPAELHHAMSDVALAALTDAYPCSNGYR